MKTIQTSNNLMPFFSIGMYDGQTCCNNSAFDSYSIDQDHKDGYINYSAEQFWDNYDHQKYKGEVLKRATEFFEDNVEPKLKELLPDIKSAKAVSIHSPREYNFDTDTLNIDILVKNGIYKNLVKMIDALPPERMAKLEKYLKDNFTSYDGFNSFTDSNVRDLRESILGEEVRETSVFIFWVWFDSEFESSERQYEDFQYNWAEYFREELYYWDFVRDGFIEEIDKNEAVFKAECVKFAQENYAKMTADEIEGEMKQMFANNIEEREELTDEIAVYVKAAIKDIEDKTLEIKF